MFGKSDDPKAQGFMKALAAAFTGGEPGTEVVDPDGSVVKIEAPDAPGVERLMRGTTTEGPYVLRVYNAQASKPDQYPSFPFIPGVMFTIMESADRAMVIWVGMGGASGFGDSAIQQTLADGWTEYDAPPDPAMPAGKAYRKDNRRRVIAHSSAGPMGFATLWESAELPS